MTMSNPQSTAINSLHSWSNNFPTHPTDNWCRTTLNHPVNQSVDCHRITHLQSLSHIKRSSSLIWMHTEKPPTQTNPHAPLITLHQKRDARLRANTQFKKKREGFLNLGENTEKVHAHGSMSINGNHAIFLHVALATEVKSAISPTRPAQAQGRSS